ncbi:MAG: hypothetical protein KGJ63_06190 [Pseudomonadota bacterium]|nr:hypothetical protein [Pseudomonadota bacterium]
MKEGYWFRSTLFRIESGEDGEVNSGIDGRHLAQWLKSQLESHGWPVIDVIPEDFGWCIRCQLKPFLLWIGCGKVTDVEPADSLQSGDNVVWHCFPVAEAPLVARLFKKFDVNSALIRLDELLLKILTAESAIQLVHEP